MAVKPIPDGAQIVTPYCTVADVQQALDFVQRAFDAQVKEAMPDSSGTILHADVILFGSHVMMGRATEQWPVRPGTFYIYVEDCDHWYRRAIDAGARSLREPTNEFYGDRSGGVEDPQGNQFWLSTHVEDVPLDELERRMATAR